MNNNIEWQTIQDKIRTQIITQMDAMNRERKGQLYDQDIRDTVGFFTSKTNIKNWANFYKYEFYPFPEFDLDKEFSVSAHLLAYSNSVSEPIIIETVTLTIFSKSKIVY